MYRKSVKMNECKKSTALKVLSLIFMISIMILNLAGCRKEKIQFETFTVIKGDIVETVSSTGNVDSTEKRSYSPGQSAKVLEILKSGQVFKKGDILIKIDDTKADLLISQSEQNLALAEQAISIAKLNYHSALDANHVAVQLAQSNNDFAEQAALNAYMALEDANTLGQANIDAANDAINSANTYLDEVKKSALSTDAMIAQAEGSLSSAENAYEQAKEAARSQSDTAEGAYQQSLNNQSITYWNTVNSLEVAASQISLMQKNIQQAEIQLELSNISLELAKLELDNYQVNAPFEGIVLSSNFSEGEIAGPGVPAISIISDSFIIKSDINETDIPILAVGQEVAITLDAYPEMIFGGIISEISPVSKNTAGIITFEVTIKPEESAKEYFRYGFSANITIEITKIENILYIPLQAIYEENSKKYVDVLSETDVITKTEVTTGNYNYDYIEIKSGLSEGDVVITSNVGITGEEETAQDSPFNFGMGN